MNILYVLSQYEVTVAETFAIALANEQVNIGFGGGVNWIFDDCLTAIPLPVGFQRNVATQFLTLGLCVDIGNKFFQAKQNCLQPFVDFNESY